MCFYITVDVTDNFLYKLYIRIIYTNAHFFIIKNLNIGLNPVADLCFGVLEVSGGRGAFFGGATFEKLIKFN